MVQQKKAHFASLVFSDADATRQIRLHRPEKNKDYWFVSVQLSYQLKGKNSCNFHFNVRGWPGPGTAAQQYAFMSMNYIIIWF